MFKFLIFLILVRLIFGWNEIHHDVSSVRSSFLKDFRKLGLSVLGFSTAELLRSKLSFAVDKTSGKDILENIYSNPPTSLCSRAVSSDSIAYEPGEKIPDVYYPSWILGKWNVTSVFKDVNAPLGMEIFGGLTLYEATQRDINRPLNYVTKFKAGPNDTVISDRLYNVEHIAMASIGRSSIINDAQADDDLAKRLRLTISPPQSNVLFNIIISGLAYLYLFYFFNFNIFLEDVKRGTLFDIELITTDREFHGNSIGNGVAKDNYFEAMERTMQVIRVRSDPPTQPLRKLIETITIYTLIDDRTVGAIQRTATYLSPYDPRYGLAQARDPAVANTAVDIRRYELIYKKI